MADGIGYGLIGAGAFGQFCLGQYRQLEGLTCVAVADRDVELAKQRADEFSIDACASVEALLKREDVDLVHVATPPATHYALVTQALEAGKHVLCEKPLAIEERHGREMIELAAKTGRVLAVNLIMRYDPLCEVVKAIVDEKWLGEPLHGFFENYAKDEPLGPDHWFWKTELSGGIFIEHGVHFFDLFRWWLGEGELDAAQLVRRPGNERIIEQVQATVRYGPSLVNFYHGFTQATRMDRQEMRIVFERGTVRLFEWVPTEYEIDLLATDATLARLGELLPDAHLTTLARYEGEQRKVESRHKRYEVDGRFVLRGDVGMGKQDLYGHVLRSLLVDQIKAIADPQHERRVSDRNGYESLALAADADRRAREADSP